MLVVLGCASNRESASLVSQSETASSEVVYDNGAMGAVWSVSCCANYDLTSGIPYGVAATMSVQFDGHEALSLGRKSKRTIAIGDSIAFDINGGTNVSAPSILLTLGRSATVSRYCNGPITGGVWRHCSVPANSLGGAQSLQRIVLSNANGSVLRPISLSNIQIVAGAAQDAGTGTGGASSAGGSGATGGAKATGGAAATGGIMSSGGKVSTGGTANPDGAIVGSHFDVTNGSAKLASVLPPQSNGTTIFAWIKFPTNLAVSTALAFGASNLSYQNYGFYADKAATIWWWDENYGPNQIAANNGGWIFVIARFTSNTHVDIGYTRVAGTAITWSVQNTISLNALQGMTVSFPGESEWFGGDLEYAGVLPRAASDAEATALSNSRVVPSGAWAFWKFENGVTTDASGNGRNWVVSGTTSAASTGAPISP